MPRKKTAGKTAKRRRKKAKKRPPRSQGAARGRPFRKGKDPRRGVGKKGRSGRTSPEVRADCQEAISTLALPKMLRYLAATRKGPADAGWRWAVDRLFDRGFGRVPLPITGDEEGDPISVKMERAEALRSRLLERLARIAAREKKKR